MNRPHQVSDRPGLPPKMASRNLSRSIKFCMVPECRTNSLSTPSKLFASVPQNKELRDLWIDAVRKNSTRSIRARRYCCEDHFNIEEDFINSKFKRRLHKHPNSCVKVKNGVVPHRFDCCQTKKKSSDHILKTILSAATVVDPNEERKEQGDFPQTEVLENGADMPSNSIQSNTEESPSELGIRIAEVHSVTRELENFINFEIDADDVEELDLMSDDFLQVPGSNLAGEEIDKSEEIRGENCGDDKHAKDISCQDNNQDSDDTFEENIIKCEDAEISNIQEEAIEIQSSDDENTNDKKFIDQGNVNDNKPRDNKYKESSSSSYDESINDTNSQVGSKKHDSNSRDDTGVHFMLLNDKESLNHENKKARNSKRGKDINFKFVNDKELEDSLILDFANDTDEIDQASADHDSDCIVVSENDTSSDMEYVDATDITAETPIFRLDVPGSKKNEPSAEVNEEITMEDIFSLENFEIIDEEGDHASTVLERLQDPKKIIIRRTNSLYSCPMNCTFLATDRQLLIEHLISHQKKILKAKEDKTYRCPLCSHQSNSKGIFINHVTYHKEPYFACKYCKYVGPKLGCLKIHMHKAHGNNLSCDNCHMESQDLGCYFRHQLRCVLMGSHMKRKRRQESKVKGEFRCHFDPCPFTADSQEALKTHEWIQHQLGSDNIKRFKCYIDYCNVETYREEIFEAHIDAHPGFQLQCKQCPYKTLDWERFKDHVIDHVNSPGQ